MTTTADDASAEPIEPADDAEALAPEERHAEADRLVRHYTLGGMAIGLVPVPVLDLAALIALQLKMLHSLATLYGVAFRADLGRSAIGSLIGGTLPSALSRSLAASLAKIIPGAGQTLAAGSLVVLNGAATYALGKVFIQHFAAGGTFLTFDPEAVRDFFEERLQEGRDVAASLRRKQTDPGSAASSRAEAP
jgi:uncharacterized protein (DUF697 family)